MITKYIVQVKQEKGIKEIPVYATSYDMARRRVIKCEGITNCAVHSVRIASSSRVLMSA